MENAGGGGGAAPTGCYKCGRPGHWSRDCPSNPTGSSNDTSIKTTLHNFKGRAAGNASKPAAEKPKKVPRTIPKLTPELLLSNDGLGYILRHFPRSFKYHGRGHEVSDLGNLLGLYAEWHSRLLPYYSFDQFVHKVEQVGASKRIKMSIRDLRERISSGGDPTKLHETPSQDNISNHEEVAAEAVNTGEPTSVQEDASLDDQDIDDFQEDMLHEIYKKGTDEPSNITPEEIASANVLSNRSLMDELPSEVPDNLPRSSDEGQMTDEQKARVEANRLKALERAAARARSKVV